MHLGVGTPGAKGVRHPCYILSERHAADGSHVAPVGVAVADNAITYSDQAYGSTQHADCWLALQLFHWPELTRIVSSSVLVIFLRRCDGVSAMTFAWLQEAISMEITSN